MYGLFIFASPCAQIVCSLCLALSLTAKKHIKNIIFINFSFFFFFLVILPANLSRRGTENRFLHYLECVHYLLF